MKRITFYGIIAGTILALPVQAGGLWLNEYGDPSGGRASAGAAAGLDDASAVAHNSASITRLEGNQLMLTVGYIEPDTEFDVESSSPAVGTGDGGSAGVGTPSLSTFYVRDLGSEKWTAGLYFAALSGAGLEYDDDWVGRYENIEVSLALLALAPTIAYKVNDKLSLGASIQIWYTKLEMDVAIPNPIPIGNRPDGLAEVDGDDYDVGFTLGLMYEFSPQTRMGIDIQSEIEISFDSDLEITPVELAIRADLDLPLATKIRIGLHHDINEK
jgi:long-chain fatty acid transport protein